MSARILSRTGAGGLLGLLLSMSVAAQEEPVAAAAKPNWTITPTASIEMTYTDNVTPGSGAKREDFITRLAPGINIDGASARLKGSLNYQWQQNLYADNDQLDNHQHSLRANGRLELVEQWFFIDASGNIVQTPVSAFGTQGVGNELLNANRSETKTWQVSPYIQGKLAGYADYQLRYSNSKTSAEAGVYSAGGGLTNQTWSGHLSGSTPYAALGWAYDIQHQDIEVGSLSDSLRTDRMLASLNYLIAPQIRLSVSVGRESDNFNLPELKRRTNQGFGFDWTPTERTSLSLKQDRRSYGDDRTISFTHRTALSAWKFTDSKAVVLPAQQFSQAPTSTFYQMLDLQLQGLFPDATERAKVVLDTLSKLGLSSNALVFGNIQSSQAFIQSRREASFTLTGVNNTVTFSVQRSASDRLGIGVAAVDDFLTTSNIQQSGISASWAHKLSPLSSLTLSGLSSRSKGDNSNQDTELKSLSLSLSTSLGYRTSASAGLRHTQFDSKLGNSYDENALIGSLFMKF